MTNQLTGEWEKGTKMKFKQALALFANSNEWLREKLSKKAKCSCGACYLCAYNLLSRHQQKVVEECKTNNLAWQEVKRVRIKKQVLEEIREKIKGIQENPEIDCDGWYRAIEKVLTLLKKYEGEK